ncbi:MAG TPA: DUF29 domain-containing protein [Geminicoccaceae bacterium]|nr:DUF29 domain-containing protein [Geminicoccus sp.]HMU50931.1 DUF29 domain-containing protein [Geminicoccaceae bacterium]
MATTLHDLDFAAWAEEQAEQLRRLGLDHPEIAAKLDLSNLAEEVADMGKSIGREFVSRLAVLLAHLAKWRWQPGLRGRSWTLTIRSQRHELSALLEDNPSLRPQLSELLRKAWKRGREQAAIETGLSLTVFPDTCPFALDQVLSQDWLPD